MRKAIVVGSGLVGSLWAYLLKSRGCEVEILEKRSDPRLGSNDSGRSINLVVTSRGLHALKSAGLLEKILPLTVPVFGRQIHPKSGPDFFQPYGRDKSECNYSVSRIELNKALISECEAKGVRTYFDHPVETIDLEQKIINCHGTNIKYDLLFAADGAGSVIRKKLAGAYPAEFQEKTEWLDSGYKELSMPPGLEKNALHIWPRGSHMLMGLANLDSSFTMTMYIPHRGPGFTLENLKSEDSVQKFFESEYSTATSHMPDFLQDFLARPEGSLGTVRMNKWVYRDSVALLGDAAHAIVPFFGQGMNLGFEDCTTLLKCLDDGRNDWATALASYDRIQRPNANAIAEMALENFTEMRDKVSDSQFQFRKKIEAVIEHEFPELYRSRYGMITYTLIPYEVARQAGLRQNELLARFSEGLSDPSKLDLQKVKSTLLSDFYPWLNQQGFTTDSYRTTL